MITIKIIDQEHKDDINIPNQPFNLFGLMQLSYDKEKWDYTIIRFCKENVTEMCFPDENYNYDKMAQNSIFVGAYDGGKCIGLAILQHHFLKYMYLYDLKVNADYRGKSVGKMLIEKSKEIAKEHGYRGIYTQGQDNNLGACLFYLKNGFVIGGLDTHVYKGTSQENKKDILFYCDITEETIK
ncbi:MAG: GNAT family N-acetyltransferase [Lachnospiraceae bacterium]|nr:GNAT family N-acetyltransferase [Lachnospiraceae bacterium]